MFLLPNTILPLSGILALMTNLNLTLNLALKFVNDLVLQHTQPRHHHLNRTKIKMRTPFSPSLLA